MKNDIHLSDDVISLAACDESSLEKELKDHLDTCIICSRRRDGLVNDLSNLGQTAAHHVPESLVSISLETQSRSTKPYDIKAIFNTYGRMTAMAAVVMIAVISFYISGKPEVNIRSGIAGLQSSQLDHSFLEDIFNIDDETLPDSYLEIACASYESNDDGFFQFLIPPI